MEKKYYEIVSVENELPKENDTYFAYIGDYKYTTAFNIQYKFFWGSHNKPTHWLKEIPAPPTVSELDNMSNGELVSTILVNAIRNLDESQIKHLIEALQARLPKVSDEDLEKMASDWAAKESSSPSDWDYILKYVKKGIEFAKASQSNNDAETVEFAEWISNNQFVFNGNNWISTKVYYSGCNYTSSEILKLFKTRKK